MGTRQRFSKEFKLEAVRLLELGQKPAAQLALEFGVRRNQLYKWKEQLVGKGATAREVAERMLFGAVDWLTDPNEPRGCLLLQAGLSSGQGNPDVPRELARRRDRVGLMLRERFERAKTEGDLPADADEAALARYIQIIFSGLCVEAAAGASSAELKEAVERALAGWPSRGA